MKKVFSYIVPLCAVLISGVLLSACLKNKDGDNQNVPAAGLMTFNLAPDQNLVGVSLTGNTLTSSPLAFTNYTGGYQPVYVGNRTVESFDYRSNTSLATSTFNFENSKYYSLFVVGADSVYKNIIAVDNIDSLPVSSGTAYVRYINAIPDSSKPAVTINAGGTAVVNDNAAFGTVSEFKAVTPGDISIAVNDANRNTIQASRTITVEGKKVYTVLLVGLPGQTDDAKKVQIRFITNGTLADTTGK